jgi:anaphase-promoting complex subunit 4
LRLLGFENAKASHQIPIFEEGQSKFAYVAWSRNRITRRGKKATTQSDDSWTKLLYDESEPDSTNKEDVEGLSLPEELMFIEVDTALPKLGPLPVSGGSGLAHLSLTSDPVPMTDPWQRRYACLHHTELAGLHLPPFQS